MVLAQSQGRAAEMAAAGWLLGVALGAGGRYGGALTVLSPLVDAGRAPRAPPEHRLFAALAAATIASVHRQLGRHAVARASDLEALALTDGTGEAGFDALLGLASDAVGLDEPEEAAARLEQARALVPPRGDEWWRQRVRLGWAEAEVQLLEGEVDAAVDDRAGGRRPRRERPARPGTSRRGCSSWASPRSAAAPATPSTTATPRTRCAAPPPSPSRSACVPLVWPARALLGALVAEEDPAESARSLAAARSAVLTLAGDLPARRAGRVARPAGRRRAAGGLARSRAVPARRQPPVPTSRPASPCR